MPKIKVVCLECGKNFETLLSAIKKGRGKFCSSQCAHNFTKNKVLKICLECKNPFEFRQSKSRIKGGRGIYCSPKCFHNSRSKLTGDKAARWNGGKIIKICPICKKKFSITPSHDQKRVYCSLKCRGLALSGEDAPNWQGGLSYKPYCPKFNEEFKDRVRAFFGYQCQMPGCNHVWQPGEKKLAVHHVNFNRKSCCDPSAPRLFVPLCPGSCHMKTNHNRPRWEKLFTDLIMTKYNGQCYLPKGETIT